MLITLRFGGASVLSQDLHSAYQAAHSNLNSLSTQVTSDQVNLHDSVGAGAGS